MSQPWHGHWWLAIGVAAQLAVFPLFAESAARLSAPVKSFSAPTNKTPIKSPVEFFRQLLAMTPDERGNFLTNYPTETRTRILTKVDEYETLDPNERALRLRATELRWYLMPLLRDSPTNRAARLAEMPDDIRELVQSRLTEWTILPTELKQEFLDNEHILRYFADVDASNSPAGNSVNELSGAEREHWNSLSEIERRQVAAGFNQFFDLTADEKQKTLNTLSEAERHQMEKTLQTFETMPAMQRAECVNAFTKFASMDALQRAEFLKNAERWSAMSPAERQVWRDLVVNVPQWPPLPTGFMPPMPPDTSPAVATNHH